MTTQGSGPLRRAWMEGLLGALHFAGFSADLAYHGYHALMMHIIGFSRLRLEFSAEIIPEQAAALVRRLPADLYPHPTEHVHQHIAPDRPTDDFEFVLDLILDGLERLRDQP